MAKTALITGITGQDGSYLAELLIEKGYRVHGLVRRSSSFSTGRIDHLYRDPHDPEARLFLHFGDMLDLGAMVSLMSETRPDEIYNLAAQSHVAVSFAEPELTGEVTGLGATRMLEAVRLAGLADTVRFYQASSSEMFGNEPAPQSEATPLAPCSPYAAAKAYSYFMTRTYREAYGIFAANGILFNHESPRRGETFVTRKLAKAAARISAGLDQIVYLGNLDAARDWGYAPEYVEAMWRMLQADAPDDFVIATGVRCSVREFAAFCFDHVGLDWEKHVELDERYRRPTEPEELIGDASKAGREIGWTAQVLAPELARILVDAELAVLESTPTPV